MALSSGNSHTTEVTKVCDLDLNEDTLLKDYEDDAIEVISTVQNTNEEATPESRDFTVEAKSPSNCAYHNFRNQPHRSVSIEAVQVTDRELQDAALRGDLEVVRSLIREGSSVNAPMRCNDIDGDVFATLLHVLSSRPGLPNGTQVINEIVRMNANLNARSSIGTTPLTRACIHKHVRAVELLLVYGADVRPRDDCGRDAVMCAVMILDRASNVEGKAPSKREVAALSAQLVSLLAEKSADLDQMGNRRAPLLEAINDSNYNAVVALTEHGAQPRFLHEAVEDAPASIIEHLIKAQANPFDVDKEGQTVLDIAFRRGDEEITTLLRDHIGDLERKRGRPMPVKKEMSLEHPRDDTSQEDAGGLGLSGAGERKKDTAWRSQGSGGRLSLRRVSQAGSSLQGLLQYQRGKNRKVVPTRNSPSIIFLRRHWERTQRACLNVCNSKYFQLVMVTALLSALFLPDIWVLSDSPQNDDLDIILVLVLALFILEILVQAIGMPSVYIGSFFFWMDLIGAASVPLDHSAINDNLPRNFDNAVVMRAARMVRLGARAGRFTKLVKLLRFLPGFNHDKNSVGAAKVMSNALMQSLSIRVSCLIIVMVMVLPLFDLATYPENDFSMKTWMNSLDFTTSHHPVEIQIKIDQFMAFYNNKDYYPFDISLKLPNGTSQYERRPDRAPRRTKNEIEIKADSGNVWSTFNFGEKNRVDAICNIVLIVAIILLMMGFSLLLSNSVSAIVLIPLENLLSGVKKMASKIFKSVTSISKTVGPEGDDSKKKEDEIFGNETELLEKVIDKLAALNAITMKSSPIDAETLEQLGENEQLPTRAMDQLTGDENGINGPHLEDPTGDNTADLVLVLEKHLDDAGIAWGYVDTWDFNVLTIADHQRHLVCLCFLIFHLGLGYRNDIQQTLTNFSHAAAKGYASPESAPYHNWFHAVDVTHSVFRLLSLCCSERFLAGHERYALIVSAMCHDIGHPGLNNPFLVETSHELAIRYNDNSPLENMHCAKLFEIVGQPKTAVFSQFDKAQYREIRQVCIEAILHTDNTQHFTMVKDLQMLYEMNSDVFDISLQMYQSSQIEFPPKEIVDIFSEPEKKKLIRNLFLHFCDVSNPVKPFTICKQWAWHIVDEFFLQGDKEKELGITVQPLNDRDKVNRPYSQVGFIEFFVAPFALSTVRLLPPLLMLTDQMIQNLYSWCEEWITTTTPTPDSEEQVKLQDRIMKLEAKYNFRESV